MRLEKKELPKSQMELLVIIEADELREYLQPSAEKLSKDLKVEGFRPGQVPYDILKSRLGEMPIWETAVKIFIDKKIDGLLEENIKQTIVGQPKIEITKLSPEQSCEFKIVLDLLPEVKLGNYKDLKIKSDVVVVSDEEADKVIENLRESRASEVSVDRKIQKGDKALVDLEMFLENVPVEGGQAKNLAIILGQDYIIPGFDDNLLGLSKEQTKDFSLEYPKDHHQKNLAGKKVDFKVNVKNVFERNLPALDNELAKGFGLSDFETLKKNIKETLLAEKKQKAKQKAELEMLEKIAESSDFGELPEVLIQSETDLMLRELEYHLTSQGANFEDYLSAIKKSREDMVKEFAPEALKRVKSALLVREIAKKEEMKAEPEELENETKRMLEYYKGESEMEEKVQTKAFRNHLANRVVQNKILEKLREWNVEDEK